MKNYLIMVHSILFLVLNVSWNSLPEVYAIPVDTKNIEVSNDQEFAEEYASLKNSLINYFGYTKEFAELVEINLRRAVNEERERQRLDGIIAPSILRQGNQGPIGGGEWYEDDDATTPRATTPGASPGDVVRGVAGILTSLGTLNVKNFWQSFVNFFPPNQREGAQAVVDASLGRRPAQWPTLPTTTTKLTTTTKDEEEVDSEETTKSASVTVVATTQAGSVSAVTSGSVMTGATPAATIASSSVTLRQPTLIERRTVTELPDIDGLRVDNNLLLGESFIPVTTAETIESKVKINL